MTKVRIVTIDTVTIDRMTARTATAEEAATAEVATTVEVATTADAIGIVEIGAITVVDCTTDGTIGGTIIPTTRIEIVYALTVDSKAIRLKTAKTISELSAESPTT